MLSLKGMDIVMSSKPIVWNLTNSEIIRIMLYARGIRMKARKPGYSTPIVPLPSNSKIRNGGALCDMATGPCACGAWHYLGEERHG